MRINSSLRIAAIHCLLLVAALFLLTARSTARETLELTFSTNPAGGKYAPRHVLAVWIETDKGTFVKTVARWGKKQTKHLARWEDIDGTDIDGRTGATLRSHGRRSLEWNFRDRKGVVVPNGSYQVRIELADHNKNKKKFHRTTLEVEKQGESWSRRIGEQDGFHDIVLSYLVRPDSAPTIINGSLVGLSKSSAILAGNLVDTGGIYPSVALYWGRRDGGTVADDWQSKAELGIKGKGPVSVEIADLRPGIVHYFRWHAANRQGGSWASATGTFIPCDARVAIKKGATWRYLLGKSTPPKSWRAVDFVDSTWGEGPSGFGYGDGDDATTLSDMRGSYVTLYLRKALSLPDPTRVQRMVLAVDYDDGFVAFLNGREVARRHVPSDQTHRTLASASHEAGTPENFELAVNGTLLRPGRNILAIEVHNQKDDSSDLSMIPEVLVWSSEETARQSQ